MKAVTKCLVLLCITGYLRSAAQSNTDTTGYNREFLSLEEALKKPEMVFRLNLSNQPLQFPDSVWTLFPNLQYLSLKNDHFRQLPAGIGYLKNLKVLDLSGNDFEELPATFSGLISLEELYLNEEKNFRFDKNMQVLGKLPQLKSLHLEGNALRSLPQNIFQLKHLENLFLNKNQFKQVPVELRKLPNLIFLDLHDNQLKLPNQFNQESDFGFTIRF